MFEGLSKTAQSELEMQKGRRVTHFQKSLHELAELEVCFWHLTCLHSNWSWLNNFFFLGETCKGSCSNAEADNKCHQDRSLRFGLGPGRPCNPYDDQEFVDKYFKLSAHQQTLSIFDGPSGYILYFWAFPRWKETTKWSDKEVWFDCIVNLWYCKLCVFIKIKLRSAVRSNLFYQAEILNSDWC